MHRLIWWLSMTLVLVFLRDPLAAQTSVGGTLPLYSADGPWLREATDYEKVFVEIDDGSKFVGGWCSGLSGERCAFGSQAFLKKVDADGDLEWLRVGHFRLNADCCAAAAALAVEPGGGELCDMSQEPLLKNLKSVDSQFIVASQLYDVDFDPASRMVAITGELLLAWEDDKSDPPIISARGVFVALLAPDGTLVSDAYEGPQPDGSPVPQVTCSKLCRQEVEQLPQEYGGRGVTFLADGDLVVTGWTIYPPGAISSSSKRSRQYFVARYSDDLSSQVWFDSDGEAGSDCGLDVVARQDGPIYVTGYRGYPRDILLIRYSLDGVREETLVTAGPKDDEGRQVELGPDGEVWVHGRFTNTCDLGLRTMGAEGGGQQDFLARFDEDLEVIDFDTKNPFASDPESELTALPDPSEEEGIERPVGGHTEYPMGIEVNEDMVGTGGVEEIKLSDGYDLRLYTGLENRTRFTAIFNVDNGGEPLHLREITVEARADVCYTVSLSARGFDSGRLIPFGTDIDACPGDGSRWTFAVSEELSDRLGIDGRGSGPVPELEVVVHFKLKQAKAACAMCKASTPGLNVSVDQMEAEVEY